MAIVEWTDLSKISGSFGGKTVQNSFAGSGIHARFSPANPNSLAQSNQRRNFAYITKLWRDLSDSDRLSWDNAPPYFPRKNKIGNPITLSPFQCFVTAQSFLMSVRVTPIYVFDPTKLDESIAELTITSLVDKSISIGFSFSPSPCLADIRHNIFISGPYSAGVSKAVNKWVKCARLGENRVSPYTTNMFALSRDVRIMGGCKYFFKVVPVNIWNGISNPIIMTSAIATF